MLFCCVQNPVATFNESREMAERNGDTQFRASWRSAVAVTCRFASGMDFCDALRATLGGQSLEWKSRQTPLET